MVRLKFSRRALPMVFPVAFSFTVSIAKFLKLSFLLSVFLFLILLFIFIIVFSCIPHFSRYGLKSHLDSELIEVENFLTIFSSYLRLGLSPECSLIASSRRYDGYLKRKINTALELSLHSGLSASQSLNLFAKGIDSREGQRLLQLFSHALSRDPEAFSKISLKLLRHLKRNRILKNQIDLLFARMRIRVTLLSLVFSAVLAVIARLFPVIVLFITSISGLSGDFHSIALHSSSNNIHVFVALGILSFINTYFVSIIVFHSYPLFLSFTSLIIYVLCYLLIPSIMHRA